MNGRSKPTYEFGEYRLIPTERILLKGESPVLLPPKAFDILVVLIENAGELVDNKHMLEAVWPDSFVEEANIHVQMSSLRKALGENGKRLYVETVPKVGYRFVATVAILQNGHGSEEKLSPDGDNLGLTEKPEARDGGLFSIISRRPILFISCVLTAILLVVTTFLVSGFLRTARADLSAISQRMRPVKLTDSGSAFIAAISRDGKYVAYETVSVDKFSTWLMDLTTKSSVQIRPPSETPFNGLAFSPDGDFIYYNAVDSQPNSDRIVYRMPKFGGESKKILVGIHSPVSFSPDGKRFAFIREFREAKETVLMTANADGTDEQPVAKRTEPDKFATGLRPAWSPDNKTIACIGRNFDEEGGFHVLTVRVADGTVQSLTSEKWFGLGNVVWLQDQDTLLVTAQDDKNFGPQQIWAVSVSGGGAATKITPELRSYVGLSLSADSGSIIAVQSESFTDVWLMPWSNTDQAKQSLSIKGGGQVDLSWMPDGRIVYISSEAGPPNIFVMNADGSNKIQLTSDTYPKRSPVVSPDGRNMIYVSNQAGDEQLWRMDIDGQNQRQVGFDWVYRHPQFSPDGKWIVYSTWQNEEKKTYLWKIPIDGGDKVSLGAGTTYTPNVSPDMKWVVYLDRDQQPGKSLIKVVPVAGGEAIKTFEVSANTPPNPIRWSPDGQSILYQTSPAGGTNLFQQPLADETPKKITDFKYDFPIHCSVSRDMKQLACVRNKSIKDVILFNLQQ